MDEQIRPINRLPHAEACAKAARILAPRTMPKGLPMNMTANRLILLLQIYRDGAAGEARIGTYETDLQMLVAARLVERRPGWNYIVTEHGDAYVKRMLATEP